MIKSRAIFLAFILVFSIGIPRVWANHLEIVSSEDKEQIITTVKAYFEHRYRSHSTLQLEDFKGLVDDTPIGSKFLSSESEKLEIELDHAKKYHLRYLEHEGGGALMIGSNTYGWYYNDRYDHSASWTDVQFLYDFIIYPGYLSWPSGPEGCASAIDQAGPRDIVQYVWQNSGPSDYIGDAKNPPFGGFFYH